MSNLPPKALRSIAARIARAMYANDRAQVRALYSELVQQMPAPSAAAPKADAGDHQSPDVDLIGIWARDKNDTAAAYKRLETRRSEWRLWADNEEIPARSSGRRIVFLGESAARGYFYDPIFAPAVVLQKLLRSSPETRDIDIVDLARSNIDPAGIVQLADQSSRLKPDLFVLFAGNNWCSSPSYDSSFRARLIEGLVNHGYRGFIDCIETWRAQRTERALDRMAMTAANTDAHLIVVVPETNLFDWREELALVVPILPGDRNARWFDLARQAQAALGGGQFSEAARLASDLVELDEATSPIGLSILARCRLHDGEVEEARRLFEAARDVRRALPLNSSPGCSKTIQNELRRSGKKHGFPIVDLPQLIRERLDGQLPDRRMFLDYCHLTSAGIRLLTEAVARIALRLFGVDARVDLRSALEELGPPPDIDADAHFMAAVHCARWQQSAELLWYHCAEAARLSSGIADKMNGYLDTFKRAGPPWLGRRFPAIIGHRRSPTYRYFCEIDPFAEKKVQDEILVAAIDKTMRELALPNQHVNGRLRSALAPGDAEIDLLSHDHFAVNHLNSVSHSLVRKSFFEAYEPVSRFVVPLKERIEFRLKMTYRTPAAEADHDLTIHLNGVEAGAFPASRDWRSVELSNLVLNGGRNELAITWPRGRGATKDVILHSVGQLRRGILPNPLVEFGHCHGLRLVKVSPCADGSLDSIGHFEKSSK
jgi:hypothetical protein